MMQSKSVDPFFTTDLCAVLGCTVPILQAGMGGVARSELAAAVSEAGAFGSLGMVRESPELITAEVERVRRLTTSPFSVNLIPSATDPGLFTDELAACVEAGVEFVTYFWDLDQDAVARAKSYGLKVLYQVGSVGDAVGAMEAGADVLIAQGVEAGGHVHGDVSSLVLLPEICEVVDVPVAGSGGFGTGKGLMAALALGAQGIHCGTSFLATTESFAHDLHKQAVVGAASNETVRTDAFAINWPKGSAVRVLASPMTDGLGADLFGHDPERVDLQQIAEEGGRPIYRWSTDSPLRNMTGTLDQLALYAGQVSGQVTEILPAAERVEAIMIQAHAIRRRLMAPA